MAGNLASVTLAREDIAGRTEMHPAPRSSDRTIGPRLDRGRRAEGGSPLALIHSFSSLAEWDIGPETGAAFPETLCITGGVLKRTGQARPFEQ
ncbi:hypothetical protein X738_02450 [Mesorhizobium sp. LNHC209A00]|nr:hypothetical protein X738_02450 [Mesorhizobium sp. LNHC209A00]